MERQKLINLNGTTELTGITLSNNNGNIELGEIAVNHSTDNPAIYFRKGDNTIAKVKPIDDTYIAFQSDIVTDIEPETIEVTDTTSTAVTLNVQGNTIYKYTQPLISLDLTTIPDSIQPSFILFTSGTTPTALTYPAGTKTQGSIQAPAAGYDYRISIINGILALTYIE